jgi:hypothetical protein
VVVVVWMMKQKELRMEIKGKAIEKLNTKISLLRMCCIVGFAISESVFFSLVWLR